MQISSRTRRIEVEKELLPIYESRRRDKDTFRLFELRGNNDRLIRRISELKVQLRNMLQSSYEKFITFSLFLYITLQEIDILND